MPHLDKSKRNDLTMPLEYLDDTSIINDPEFEKHIADIYSTELQLNISNT